MNASAFRHILGGFVVSAFVGTMIALFVVPVPSGNHDLIVFMLGQLSGFAGAVVTFHYGSSQGSKDKSALLGGGSDAGQ